MKTDVIVRIDCNKKTCGKCEWLSWDSEHCALYTDKRNKDYTKLESRAKRCEQCLKGELRP